MHHMHFAKINYFFLQFDSGSPVIYKNKIIGIVTYREKYRADLCILMRVHNLKMYLSGVPSTSMQVIDL